MVSYSDFRAQPARSRLAAKIGLHALLGAEPATEVYLDNGAFALMRRSDTFPPADYEAFVASARPDWWPIARDFIPTPAMSAEMQDDCFDRTMAMNRAYSRDGFVPVVHVGPKLEEYIAAIHEDTALRGKPSIAIGGMVPNLLRSPKAVPYEEVLRALLRVRLEFAAKQVHVFGVGGTATLHLCALLGIDSVDSSGWRNRAARGIIQQPGQGDRMVANLGSWRGRQPTPQEWEGLAQCHCPACTAFGLDGLTATGIDGFCNRATHNLDVLLREAAEIDERLADGTYADWYATHLDNSTYLPLVRKALELRESVEEDQSSSALSRASLASA